MRLISWVGLILLMIYDTRISANEGSWRSMPVAARGPPATSRRGDEPPSPRTTEKGVRLRDVEAARRALGISNEAGASPSPTRSSSRPGRALRGLTGGRRRHLEVQRGGDQGTDTSPNGGREGPPVNLLPASTARTRQLVLQRRSLNACGVKVARRAWSPFR